MSSYYANFVKKGNPNGNGLAKWQETSFKRGEYSAFIRWFDGKAESVTSTSYPLRDELNRHVVLKTYGMTEEELK